MSQVPQTTNRRYRQTDNDEHKICPYCGLSFKPRGFKTHEKSCKSRALIELEKQANKKAEKKRQTKRQRLEADDADAMQLDNGMHAEDDIANIMQQIDDNGTYTENNPELDMPEAGPSGQPMSEYEIDDIRTEYHPSCGRAPHTDHFDEYKSSNETSRLATPLSEPWKPWRTREDFEFAEIALQAALNREQTTALITLFNKCLTGEGSFTLQSYSDVTSGWEGASNYLTSFTKQTLAIPYKKEVCKFDFWYRSLWGWINDLVGNPELAPFFEWDAQRLFKFDGERFIRFYHEPWTGDRFWDVQSGLPEGVKPFAIILYSDKTKLSSFGTQMGYPVIARCANLPVEIRNGDGVGGGYVVGWLPIVPEDQDKKGTKLFADFKRAVWHESFKKLFEALVVVSADGTCFVHCGDDVDRGVCPFIMIVSADFEEQCFVVNNRGFQGLFPCPVCLVPKEDLSNVENDYELRSAAQTIKIVSETPNLNRKEKDKLLKAIGMQNVKNAFWAVPHSNPHQAISWDRMHSYAHGLGGKHLLPLITGYISNHMDRSAAVKVDAQMALLPQWRGLHHFDKIFEHFNDASKFEDVLKMLVFAAHNVIDEVNHPLGYHYLKCLRSYVRLDMYAALEVHTEKTLFASQAELVKFAHLIKETNRLMERSNDEPKNWDIPKMHTHKHMISDIKAKGVTRNYNTKVNEKMHGPLKKIYQLRTNFKNIEEQILKVNHHKSVSSFIRLNIDIFDDSVVNDESELNSGNSSENQTESILVNKQYTRCKVFGHIIFGAPQKMCPFAELEEEHKTNTAFKGFRTKLAKFLFELLQAHDIPLPHNQYPVIATLDKYTEFRNIKVEYESKVDWKTTVDYLKCSQMFHGASRYDCVIVQTVKGQIFARLIYVFSFEYGDNTYGIALIRPYDALTGQRKKKDRDLGLIRVRPKPIIDTEFISVRSIVRGALLTPTLDNDYSDHYVIENIDTDMFLRTDDSDFFHV